MFLKVFRIFIYPYKEFWISHLQIYIYLQQLKKRISCGTYHIGRKLIIVKSRVTFRIQPPFLFIGVNLCVIRKPSPLGLVPCCVANVELKGRTRSRVLPRRDRFGPIFTHRRSTIAGVLSRWPKTGRLRPIRAACPLWVGSSHLDWASASGPFHSSPFWVYSFVRLGFKLPI